LYVEAHGTVSLYPYLFPRHTLALG
jgi:hypothetical protein